MEHKATDSPIFRNGKSEGYAKEFAIVTTLFFMWGLLTSLNDILIPHLKAIFELNYAEAMLVQFVFFMAYFLVSMPSSVILKAVGYKNGIVIGLAVAGLGTLAFYPAAGLRSYPLFLLAFFVLASGITLLQVAANPYVTILGKPEGASSRLNLSQAFNSLGTTIGPYFGSMLILSVGIKSAEELARMSPAEIELYKNLEASSVQVPYLWLAGILFLLAFSIYFSHLPEIHAEAEKSTQGKFASDEIHSSAWKYRHLLLGAIAIFLYVGAEVSIGSFLVNYMGQDFVAGFSPEQAGKFVAFYWGGAMVGRFIGSGLLTRLSPNKTLGFNALVAAMLVTISMLSTGHLAMWTILAVGLFNSIMFPTIFTLALKGLGKHTKQGSGILITAIVGGAVIPVLQGALADVIGIHTAFILPVLCYLYITYYGYIGSTPEFE
jgi:FHS family L-fucose permease-like MFS transporter